MQRYESFICDSARWEGFEHRADDIVVTTPPKCGTTWMQMCCLVLVHGPTLPAPLGSLAPWLDQTLAAKDEVHARLAAQAHRRVIKTHTPLDGLPLDARVTYIGVGRDPRDVALSAQNHFTNMDLDAVTRAWEAHGERRELPVRDRPADLDAAFRQWVDDERPKGAFSTSLEFTVHHLASLWARRHDPNVHLFHYADMRRDPEGQLRRLADVLDVEVPEARWPALVEATSHASMSKQADVLAPNAEQGLWRDNRAFFAEARHGSWRDVVSPATLARYAERLAELAPDAELMAWLHTGGPDPLDSVPAGGADAAIPAP